MRNPLKKEAGPVLIIGGGVTGLTVGYQLARSGSKVLIVEKEARTGGLARSFVYGDFTFDIGPHRFYSQEKPILDFIDHVLSDNAVKISRKSGVHFRGRYYRWPIHPFAVFGLPVSVVARSMFDLLRMGFKGKDGTAGNFEDYVLGNYGPTLYQTFFRDYTQKFLQISPRETHVAWATASVKRAMIKDDESSRSLLSIARSMLRTPPPPTAADFIYPEEGIGQFCDLLAQKIRSCGGTILNAASVTNMVTEGNEIGTVLIGPELCIAPRRVVWTAPVNGLCSLLGLPCEGLSYLSLLIFNVEVDKLAEHGYQWCYFGDKDMVFSRVSVPSLFHKGLAPAGAGSLCVEVTCMEGDAAWNAPENLIPAIRADLKKAGFIADTGSIRNIHIERIANAYPRYRIDYQEKLATVRGDLSRYGNLTLAGRTGLFWYNNMDDSIRNGLETAAAICAADEGTRCG